MQMITFFQKSNKRKENFLHFIALIKEIPVLYHLTKKKKDQSNLKEPFSCKNDSLSSFV